MQQAQFKGFGKPPETEYIYTLILEHQQTKERFHIPLVVPKLSSKLQSDKLARARADLICSYILEPETTAQELLAGIMGDDLITMLQEIAAEPDWKGNMYGSMRLKAKNGRFYNLVPIEEQRGPGWKPLDPEKEYAKALILEAGVKS